MAASTSELGLDQITAVLVDDQEADRKQYGALLGGHGVTVHTLAPTPDPVATVDAVEARTSERASVVVLDYRLDEDPQTKYRGGSLAAAIRERSPGVPVVQLTTEAKLQQAAHQPGVEDLFDLRVLKSELSLDPATYQRQIAETAAGYWRLRVLMAGGDSGWEIVKAAMNASDNDLHEVVRTEPERTSDLSSAELARWVREATKVNGVLLDAKQTRALLGLNDDSFAQHSVDEWLRDAEYDGIFASIGRRFWANRVRRQLADAVGESGPVGAQIRARALASVLGPELEAAVCNWCSSDRVLRACARCGETVDGSHALNFKQRPDAEWALRPVVCFQCVVKGRVRPAQLVAAAHSVADALATGELRPPLQDS